MPAPVSMRGRSFARASVVGAAPQCPNLVPVCVDFVHALLYAGQELRPPLQDLNSLFDSSASIAIVSF